MMQSMTTMTASLIRLHWFYIGIWLSQCFFNTVSPTTATRRQWQGSVSLPLSNYNTTYLLKPRPLSSTISWYNTSIPKVISLDEKDSKLGIKNQIRNDIDQDDRQIRTIRKKLIIDLSGYNIPIPATLLKNAAMMKGRGYSGSIIRLENMWNEPFVNDIERIFNEADFATNIPQLQKMSTQLTSYTHNFLVCYSQMSSGWTWLSDTDWAYTEEIFTAFATALELCGDSCKGLMFDAEAYGLSPWIYTEEYFEGKALEEVSAVVFQRGQRVMEILQGKVPNIIILFLYLTTPIVDGWDNYLLYKSFIEGMLDKALPTVRFLDGNEPSYYYLNSNDFRNGRNDIQMAYTVFDESVQEKFKQIVETSNAVYVDGVLNLWNSTRFFGYYNEKEKNRLLLIQHNTYWALRFANEYIWVYNENMNYYNHSDNRGRKVRIPRGLVNAIRDASRKVQSNSGLGYSVSNFVKTTKAEFERRVSISGLVNVLKKHSNSKPLVLSGWNDEYGDESSCVVYNAYGNFDCVFPYGSNVTLRPRLLDENGDVIKSATFRPRKRIYCTLTNGYGEQNFTQRT
jgi:hypothetical protein